MNGRPAHPAPLADAAQPPAGAPAEDWVGWFWSSFLPGWTARAGDPAHGGFFDGLDALGTPEYDAPKTVLAQARLLYTFAHLALLTGDAAHREAARAAHGFLTRFRKAPGLYRRAVSRAGTPTGKPDDAVARSYDQSFVVLALATWERLAPDDAVGEELEACWRQIEARLTDPATGLLLEHDGIFEPAAPTAPPRAQNPHMHLYEAALQAFEMTGGRRWLERAAHVRAIALDHFLDRETGTITEFLTPGLRPLPGRDGARREIGHQCEWAWLLNREAALDGTSDTRAVAARLMEFADARGFAASGVLSGAAFDAVASDGAWREETFLLWPQTEAVKARVTRFRAGDVAAGEAARNLMALIFTRYFGGRMAFANQLDANGTVLWPDALSRLLYHLVLALTEGAGAGLWSGPTRYKNGGV